MINLACIFNKLNIYILKRNYKKKLNLLKMNYGIFIKISNYTYFKNLYNKNVNY